MAVAKKQNVIFITLKRYKKKRNKMVLFLKREIIDAFTLSVMPSENGKTVFYSHKKFKAKTFFNIFKYFLHKFF